tara:strand:+ start:2419 stop:8418 length:6000 start_codon:yes stop_codon:yes gene_type:complete
MGLSRLDNFLKSVRGSVIYVDPGSLDATDSIENQGNSLTRPFKTIQRALVEASRFSYQKGLDNDRFAKTTVVLYPGEHTVDNRPGWIPIGSNNYRLRSGETSSDFGAWDLTTNYDLTSVDNELYKLNSIFGGVIVPRGVSLVAMDLRKTRIRPKYVPNPENDNIERSSVFRVTGGCYFWQFTILDADPNGLCFKDYTTNTFVPNFSHNKLTCFEFADGVNNVNIDDDFISGTDGEFARTDLDMYYAKVGIAYGPSSGREIEPDWPSEALDIQPKIDEFRIVGSKGKEVGISSIRAGDGTTTSTIITVTLDSATDATAFDVDTPLRITNAGTGYDGQHVVSNKVDATNIQYKVQSAPDDPLPTIASATANVTVDTVTSASPYIFNCSLRSVFGMCGLFADGDKATGFQSMVLAQFTGIGLQKDNNAFVKYNSTSGIYEDKTATGNSNLESDSRARYKPGYANFHIKVTNNSIVQAVSCFAIGYANHFTTASGGELTITNSNSNFGANAFTSDGFRRDAFTRDDVGYITHIIPPKVNNNVETGTEFLALDVKKIVGMAATNKMYLYNETNANVPPESIVDGYRIGAKENDTLNVLISKAGITTTIPARIIMPNTEFTASEVSAEKKFEVGNSAVGVNSVSNNVFTLTEDHNFINGETIRINSQNGHLPDGLVHNTVYFAITSGTGIADADQIKVGATLNDALGDEAITINSNGGLLSIVSRVSDKKSGDIGHPIQYDTNSTHWFVNVATGSTEDSLYNSIVGLGSTSLGDATARSFINRKSETRSLDDTIYRARYVLPSASSLEARPPTEGFVIQESNASIGSTDGEVAYLYNPNSVTLDNSTELRNPRYIADASWSGNVATVVTEIPHNLQTGATVEILNVTSTNNTAGVAKSMFNNTFSVTGVSSSRQFTFALTDDPGTFTNNTSDRTTSLPHFRPKKTPGTYYIYQSDEVQEYISGKQDGIYHLLLVNASNAPTITPYTGSSYSQPIQSLYPQTNRDNPASDPDPSKCFAVPNTIGQVAINEQQKSITKETLDNRLSDISVGFGLTDIRTAGASGTTHTLYSKLDHGLNRVAKLGITSTGSNYIDGNYYNVQLVGFGASTVGKNATARVTVESNAVTSVKIIDGGSSYGVGNTLALSGVAGTTGNTGAVITVNEIYSNIGDTVKITGITPDANSDYNTVYKITHVGVGSDKEVNVSSANTVSRYKIAGIGATDAGTGNVIITGPTLNVFDVFYDRVVGLATITTVEPHGLVVDESVNINGANDNILNGDAVITKVGSTTSFVANVGVATITPTTGLTGLDAGNLQVYPLGFAARGGNIVRATEATSGRLIAEYAGITTITSSSTSNTATTISIANALNFDLNVGDFLLVGNEIVRIKTTVSADAVSVFRGLMGTTNAAHDSGVVIKRVFPRPIELRRNSIIRSAAHTFEYLGYGPGNYSTSFPTKQDRNLEPQEELLAQSIKSAGGSAVFTSMNQDGDFFIGNRKVNSSTGKDEIFDAPIPTVTGEDLGVGGGVNVGFDVIDPLEATVKRSLIVEGGSDGNIISKFDGPVILNNKLTSTSAKGVEAASLFLQGDRDVSRKYTVGISTPSLSGNVGDVVYDGNATSGGLLGWVYTSATKWERFGRIGLDGAEPSVNIGVRSDTTYVGLATQISIVGLGLTVTNQLQAGIATFTINNNPRVAISTGNASGENNLLGIGTQINFVGIGLTVGGEFNASAGIATILITANQSGAGGSTPQGPTYAVQYNNSGFFGGGSGFTYDGTNLDLNGSTATSLSKITQSGGGAALEVASGSVGLGTTGASLAKLEVVTASGEALRIKSTAGSGNVVRIDSGTTTGDANPVIVDVSGNLGVKTTTADKGALDVLGNVAITGETRLYESTRNYYAALKAPTLESSVTLTLPSRVGVSSDLLITTGSGILDYISASSIVGLALTTTDDLTEGANNLYFTNERAQDAVDLAISAGIQTGITVTYDDSGNKINFNVDSASPYPFTTKGFPGSF